MSILQKRYVEKHFPSGKRDLYAAFILRCLELCRTDGRVAMVTMQNWMFLQRFASLRSLSEEKLSEARKKGEFAGLLRETSIESLAHLGSNAFEEIGGEVVQNAMFILMNHFPHGKQRLVAFRLIGVKSAKEKADILSSYLRSNYQYSAFQDDFLVISDTPILYWLGSDISKLVTTGIQLGQVVDLRQGMATADNERFLRHIWEKPNNSSRWQLYAKGGGYRKWIGFEELCFDYRSDGSFFRAYESEKFEGTQWDGILGRKFSLVERYMHQPCIVYTLMANGSMGPRFWPGGLFDVTSISIHHENQPTLGTVAAVLSSRYTSYILRSLTQNLKFNAGYTAKLPLFPKVVEQEVLSRLSYYAKHFKAMLISLLPTERIFDYKTEQSPNISEVISSLLCSIEGIMEVITNKCLELTDESLNEIYRETGLPAGLYPLVNGYDSLPELASLALPMLLPEIKDYLSNQKRISFSAMELSRVRANLRSLYEVGPGAKNIGHEVTDEATENSEGEEEIISGAYIPIPTETFLEELSIKMQLHPISVYWLLEELKVEGARCKPEELRLLEDRLSVLVLRLLGHRWPKQLEAGEPVPAWASSDGIIPLVAGAGEVMLAEQLRARLRVEDGELGVQQIDALLTELTGLSLEEWLRRRFFSRHVSQFKYRPIAWHLASIPVNNGKKRRGGSQHTPAFECLLYYHVCSGDALARIRTQYVEPLLRAERQKMEEAYLFRDETTSGLANERIQELEAFVEKLRVIEEQGFVCPELETFMIVEPLDRWSGDGYLAPANRDELLRNEQAWRVDINDGVRVNIAPLQLAGVLASDVLKTADAKKALADRARWRADERRWVRDGKLPRCGWMDERVPESPRWTDREPERIAEQIKLEQKRLALKGRRAEEVEL